MKDKCKVSLAGRTAGAKAQGGGPACVFEERKDSQCGYNAVNRWSWGVQAGVWRRAEARSGLCRLP